MHSNFCTLEYQLYLHYNDKNCYLFTIYWSNVCARVMPLFALFHANAIKFLKIPIQQ